jgi:hypothetical protein
MHAVNVFCLTVRYVGGRYNIAEVFNKGYETFITDSRGFRARYYEG